MACSILLKESVLLKELSQAVQACMICHGLYTVKGLEAKEYMWWLEHSTPLTNFCRRGLEGIQMDAHNCPELHGGRRVG